MTRARWPAVRLGDVLEPLKTTEAILTPASERFATIKLYGKGIVERSITSGKTPRPFTGYRLAAGELVYSRIDARHGAFALVPRALSGCVVSKDFPHFALRAHRLDADYLRFIVTSPTFYRRIAAMSFGATNRQRMGEDAFLALQIPLPPIDEQRRIAALLDQVDELRAKRRRTLALLEDLRAARLQQFLERSKCSEVPFGSFISDLRYGSSSKAADHGSLVMRIPNVQRGALWLDEMKRVPLSSDETGTFALLEGDLLMVRSNGSPDLIGRAAAFTSTRIAGTPLASESVVFASYLLRVRLSPRALPAYVEAVLASSPLRRSIRAIARTSAGQYNLNGPAVRNLPIPLPPLADQQQVVAELETISAAEADHRTHLTKLDELFASLQHRAFTGQL